MTNRERRAKKSRGQNHAASKVHKASLWTQERSFWPLGFLLGWMSGVEKAFG
jgi:hypothetical protein